MFDSKMLGYRIKEYRKQVGLSQAELAKKIQIQPSTLCEYEAGHLTPSMKVFVDIVNALNCTASDLLLDSINSNRLQSDELSEEQLNSIHELISTIKD
jgi:transcriptional regulator with XRE-family HTH domain